MACVVCHLLRQSSGRHASMLPHPYIALCCSVHIWLFLDRSVEEEERKKANSLIFNALDLDLEVLEQSKCGIRTQRERERQRQRQRDRETETERQTDRHRQRQTDRDRNRDRDRDRESSTAFIKSLWGEYFTCQWYLSGKYTYKTVYSLFLVTVPVATPPCRFDFNGFCSLFLRLFLR